MFPSQSDSHVSQRFFIKKKSYQHFLTLNLTESSGSQTVLQRFFRRGHEMVKLNRFRITVTTLDQPIFSPHLSLTSSGGASCDGGLSRY